MEGYLKVMVLKVLAAEPLNGYTLMKRIAETTGHKPSPGSMYPLLKALKDQQVIAEHADGRSRFYSLTPKGKRSLQEFLQHQEKFATALEKNVKVMESLFGKKHDKHAQLFFNKLKRGEAPFGALTPEFIALRDACVAALENGLSAEKEKKLRAIIIDATKEVKQCSRL